MDRTDCRIRLDCARVRAREAEFDRSYLTLLASPMRGEGKEIGLLASPTRGEGKEVRLRRSFFSAPEGNPGDRHSFLSAGDNSLGDRRNIAPFRQTKPSSQGSVSRHHHAPRI